MLLEDFNGFNGLSILESDLDKGQRTYYLRGVFSKIGVVNKNKRIYPEHVMRPVVESLQEDIKNGGFVGEINHPNSQSINMDKISHKVTKLAIAEDGSVVGEMVPAGPNKNVLLALLEDRIRCGVSTRGTGSLKPYNGPLAEGQYGIKEVGPDYRMAAIDIVFNPSAGTFPDAVLEDTQEFGQFAIPNKFKAIWDDVFK